MKLKNKLITGFASMVILFLIAGTESYLSVSRVSKSAEVFEKNMLYLDLVSRLQLAIERSVMPPNDYIIHGNIAERKNFLSIAEQVDKMIKVLHRMAFSEEERNLINETETTYASLKEKALRILNDTLEGKDPAKSMEEMDAMAEDAIRKIDMLNHHAYKTVVKTAYLERLYRKHTHILLLICAALFVTDVLVFGFFIWHSISKPLKSLQNGVSTITHGKLNHRISVTSHGEFKELADSFNYMVERLQGSFSDLEGEKDKLQTLLLNVVDGVIAWDTKYNLLFMNPVAETIFGRQYGELKGHDFFSSHKEGDRLMRILQSDQLPVTTKVSINSCILHINATSIKKSDGTKIGYIMIVRDITGQERAREKLEELAITDSMTKVFNRNHFQYCLGVEFSKAQRYKFPLSLIMLDIDHFKSFNDKYGHQIGDIVLVTLAQLLKNTIRKIDIVARYGGEEFVIILPHTGAKEAQLLAERLREKTENHIIRSIMDRVLNFTISLGIATFINNNFKNMDDLIKGADDALYEAKKGGRNRVEVFFGLKSYVPIE
ncbi:MAG TPA: diguanylate cyclase [Candidatus Brocadiales bacterium]|nr:diguanylate cyclase [Candidatus Brocadiales bacterium]